MSKYNYKRNEMSKSTQLLFNEFVQVDIADKQILPDELIFNYYGSKGGTKEFNESDYSSYLEYATAKRNYEKGQVFTPYHLCKFVMDSLSISEHDTVMDLTCGIGSFFNFAPNEQNCYGVEIDESAFNVARKLYPNANIALDDVRFHTPEMNFDYIVINPPFYLNFFSFEDSHSFVIHKALEVVRKAGIVAIIVPTTYLNSTEENEFEISRLNEKADFLGQFELGDEVFKENRVTVPTKLMLFKRTESPSRPYSTKTECLDITNEQSLEKVKSIIDDEKKKGLILSDYANENNLKLTKEQIDASLNKIINGRGN